MDEFQSFIKDVPVKSGFYSGMHVTGGAYRLIRARTFSGGLRVEGIMLNTIDGQALKSWFPQGMCG